MLASARKKVVVVLDQGSLFRGNAEGKIREKVIAADLVECVISLPEKLFYNTGAPGAILVFNKNKGADRKDRMLFINASNEYQKHKEIRRLNQLSPENISKIVGAFETFEEIDGFSAIKTNDEVLKRGGNLNVTLYVSDARSEEIIDIKAVLSDIDKIDKQIEEVSEKLNSYMRELGYLD